MSTSIAEINRIVRTSPTELKYLFKSPTEDKRRLTRLISHLVPYRIGIEFETFGAVGQYLFPSECIPNEAKKTRNYRLRRKRVQVSTKKKKNIDELIRDKLKLVAFREDSHYHTLEPPLNQVHIEEERDMNEVRISISGYKQLITLWNTLQVLNKCLVIPSINGGIHIHVDAEFVQASSGRDFAVNWFNQPAILSEVLQIFEGYSGTYNKRSASINKGNYVRISDYPTIEFRIGRLTYDYPTLIRYIIKCSELVRKCKHEFKINPDKFTKQSDKPKCSNSYTVTLEHGGDGNDGLRFNPDNSSDHVSNEYVFRHLDEEELDQIFGTSISGPYWSVYNT